MSEKFRSHIEKITSLSDDEFSLVSSFFTKQTFDKNQI